MEPRVEGTVLLTVLQVGCIHNLMRAIVHGCLTKCIEVARSAGASHPDNRVRALESTTFTFMSVPFPRGQEGAKVPAFEAPALHLLLTQDAGHGGNGLLMTISRKHVTFTTIVARIRCKKTIEGWNVGPVLKALTQIKNRHLAILPFAERPNTAGTWLRPEVVGEVSYYKITKDRKLQHSSSSACVRTQPAVKALVPIAPSSHE